MSNRNASKVGLSLKQQTYIEVIDDIERRHGHAHVTAIAGEMGVRKPSVVQMLHRLADAGVVNEGKGITLSEKGRRLAEELGSRQALLQDFMVKDLGMDRKTASDDACRMEHIVSPAFIRGLRQFRKGLDDRVK